MTHQRSIHYSMSSCSRTNLTFALWLSIGWPNWANFRHLPVFKQKTKDELGYIWSTFRQYVSDFTKLYLVTPIEQRIAIEKGFSLPCLTENSKKYFRQLSRVYPLQGDKMCLRNNWPKCSIFCPNYYKTGLLIKVSKKFEFFPAIFI
jgi:hypothetical protein